MTIQHRLPQWNDFSLIVNRLPGKAHCEPNWSWQPAPLKDYDLWYTVSGHGEVRINDTLHQVFPGAFFLLQPGDNIIATHDPQHPLFALYCHFEPFDQSGESLRLPLPQERFVAFRNTAQIEPLMHQLIDLALQSSQDHRVEIDILLKLIVTRWIKEWNDQATPSLVHYHNQLVTQVQDNIRSHLKNTDDYNELTRGTGFSSRHISRIMKQCTGLSLKETITKLRMERAVHLLSETALSVGEIADALGYSDIYTFSKLFKRYFGYSPTKIRSD